MLAFLEHWNNFYTGKIIENKDKLRLRVFNTFVQIDKRRNRIQ